MYGPRRTAAGRFACKSAGRVMSPAARSARAMAGVRHRHETVTETCLKCRGALPARQRDAEDPEQIGGRVMSPAAMSTRAMAGVRHRHETVTETCLKCRGALLARQRDAQVRQQDDHADETDQAGEDQAPVTELPERLRERPPEQDRD